MYKERMNSYYPEVIRTIYEFQAIIDSEYPEFEKLSESRDNILNDAYLTTMGEGRIAQWEKIFNIKPFADSTVDDRRDVIIARIRGQSKLNTETINSIVKTFTGGSANSWIEDGVLYVEITPPPGNKQYKFENIEQELSLKVPAHLGLNVSRNYYDWVEVKTNYPTWQEVNDSFSTWNDVFMFSPFASQLRR